MSVQNLDTQTTFSGTQEWTGNDAQSMTRGLPAQGLAALTILGPGVVSGFAVTDSGGLFVDVAAGLGIAVHSAKGTFAIETTVAVLNLAVTNNTTNYIWAEVEISTNDTRFTRLPKFTATLLSTNTNGILLATVTTSAGAITSVVDSRTLLDFGNDTFNINALTLDETLADADAMPRYDAGDSVNKKNTYGAFASYVIAKLLGAARNFGNNVNVAGVLGIGTTSPNASAAVQIDSTTKGFLGPRMTTTQRDAISSPLTGLQIYNTSIGQLEFYSGAAWLPVGPAGSGEINTSSNVGSGAGLALPKSGLDLPFKSITAGTGITVGESSTEVQIAFNGAIGSNDYYDFNRLGSNPATPSSGIMRIFTLAANSLLSWKDSGGTVRSAALAGAVTGSGLTQATGKLLGRGTSATGPIEEITLGTGLSFSGTTLNASGGGGGGSPTVVVVAAVSDIFTCNTDDGNRFEMVANVDSELVVSGGSPTSGVIREFIFYAGDDVDITFPDSFVSSAGGLGTTSIPSGRKLRVIAEYEDVPFGDVVSFASPIWWCEVPEIIQHALAE